MNTCLNTFPQTLSNMLSQIVYHTGALVQCITLPGMQIWSFCVYGHKMGFNIVLEPSEISKLANI